MNKEYILKHIEKDRPFKTEKECVEYYMDKCWLKQDVASDLFYYKLVIDRAIEYVERNCLEFNVKYACQGLNNDKVDVLLNILRGE